MYQCQIFKQILINIWNLDLFGISFIINLALLLPIIYALLLQLFSFRIGTFVKFQLHI